MRVTNQHRFFRAAVRLALVLLLCLPAGCQNREKEENRRLAEEVMAIHDEAMAKMTQIHELKLQLEQLANGIGNEELVKAIEDLQEAHTGMMVWMRAYHPPDESQTVQQARTYLTAEKDKIERVRLDINNAIAQGQRLISKP